MRGRQDTHRGHAFWPLRGRVRGFVQPWLLLLLLEKPTHGYDLMERLAGEDGMPDADAGLLYRTLRQFERQGLVESTWDTDVPGPARRRYQVTGEGVEYLHAWALNIRRIRERLDRFLSAYDERFKTSEGR